MIPLSCLGIFDIKVVFFCKILEWHGCFGVVGHVDEVWGLATHPSLPQFVSAGWDRLLQLWDGLSHSTVWSKDIEVRSSIFEPYYILVQFVYLVILTTSLANFARDINMIW